MGVDADAAHPFLFCKGGDAGKQLSGCALSPQRGIHGHAVDGGVGGRIPVFIRIAGEPAAAVYVYVAGILREGDGADSLDLSVFLQYISQACLCIGGKDGPVRVAFLPLVQPLGLQEGAGALHDLHDPVCIAGSCMA